MKRRFWLLLVVVLSLALGAAGDQAVAAARVIKSSCLACHADVKTVLPKDHPDVKGGDIASCFSCHAPDFSGKIEPNRFSARIHRAHGGAQSKVDCLTCHTWMPKKSFGLLKQKASWGAPSKDDLVLLKKMVNSWAGSAYLDSLHARANVTCAGCHGKQLPKEDDTVENAWCLDCHGSLEKLAGKTANPDFPKRNPHKSHLGDLNCTVCHKAHRESKVYCLGCHSQFDMKISGGSNKTEGSAE
jgi:hypothetical protein